MTREEAYNRIRGYVDVGRQNDFLKALEALEIIKFDNPKIIPIIPDDIYNQFRPSIAATFEEALKRFGYKVVKNDQ